MTQESSGQSWGLRYNFMKYKAPNTELPKGENQQLVLSPLGFSDLNAVVILTFPAKSDQPSSS